MEYYSAIKKWNSAVCDKDGPSGYYAKWRKKKQTQQRKHIPRGRQKIHGYQSKSWVERGSLGKGVNCMVTDGKWTFGCEHDVVYTDAQL